MVSLFEALDPALSRDDGPSLTSFLSAVVLVRFESACSLSAYVWQEWLLGLVDEVMGFQCFCRTAKTES